MHQRKLLKIMVPRKSSFFFHLGALRLVDFENIHYQVERWTLSPCLPNFVKLRDLCHF